MLFPASSSARTIVLRLFGYSSYHVCAFGLPNLSPSQEGELNCSEYFFSDLPLPLKYSSVICITNAAGMGGRVVAVHNIARPCYVLISSLTCNAARIEILFSFSWLSVKQKVSPQSGFRPL